MKRFYLFLVLAMVAVAPRLSAQSLEFSGETYHRTYAGYNIVNLNWGNSGDDNSTLLPLTKGFTVGHLESAKLFESSIPILVEYGVNLQYNAGRHYTNIMGNSAEYRINTFAVNVPVHAALNLKLDKVTINPYFGVNFRVNLLGSYTTEHKIGDNTTNKKVRLFDDSDEKGAAGDAAWERFQTGLSYGVSVGLGRYTVNLGFISDLMPLVDHDDDYTARLNMTTISLGYAF